MKYKIYIETSIISYFFNNFKMTKVCTPFELIGGNYEME